MTETPSTPDPDDTPLGGLAATAAEPPEESVRKEAEAVGDHPDTGGLVPPDSAQ